MIDPATLPPGVDPTALQLSLLTEMWLLTVTMAVRHDTAPQMFLFGAIREMSRDFRSVDRDYIAVVLDGWVERLEVLSRTHAQAMDDLRSTD